MFTTILGTELDAANMRRDLRRAFALVPGIRRTQVRPVLLTGACHSLELCVMTIIALCLVG